MPVMMEHGFRDLIRDLIGDRKQRDIADLAGISQTTVHNMLRGAIPSRETLWKLALGLGLPESERSALMRSAGYPTDPPPVMTEPMDADQLSRKVAGNLREILEEVGLIPAEEVPEPDDPTRYFYWRLERLRRESGRIPEILGLAHWSGELRTKDDAEKLIAFLKERSER